MTPTPYPMHLPGAPTGQPHNTAVRVNRHEDFEHLPSQPDHVNASATGKRVLDPINAVVTGSVSGPMAVLTY
jgi:hypothetical protein